MLVNALCTRVVLFAALATASVTVRKTGKGPTGYEVSFHYFNASATNVTVSGGLQTFTDQFRTNVDGSARYDPRNYKPGWFPSAPGASAPKWVPYHMTSHGNGSWVYTTPLPSGTYNYAFLVNCPPNGGCSIDSGRYVIDPDNPPFVNVQGDQIQSTFQVPFDAKFQSYTELNLNFDFALPVDKQHRGTVQNVNYTSPGSVHPAPDVHEFALYLPHGYTNTSNTTYPVLYLSHGGDGNGQDWENLVHASHILDRLILERHIPPTIVVMPSFYNLAPEYKFVYGIRNGTQVPSLATPSSIYIRENYFKYLFPYVEETLAVSRSPSHRAFAGLSLGGLLTYEMYVNATEYFAYYGIFSGVLGPTSLPSAYINASMIAANPRLKNVGIFSGVGLYDVAFPDVRLLQAAMQSLSVPFVSRIVPYGYHAFNTWADCLWNFGKEALWKELPFEANPITSPLL